MAGSRAVSKADDDPLDHDSHHDLIEDAILYIAEKKYREGITNNRKRQIRTKANKFVLRNDELYYNPGNNKLVR